MIVQCFNIFLYCIPLVKCDDYYILKTSDAILTCVFHQQSTVFLQWSSRNKIVGDCVIDDHLYPLGWPRLSALVNNRTRSTAVKVALQRGGGFTISSIFIGRAANARRPAVKRLDTHPELSPWAPMLDGAGLAVL